MAVVDKKSDKNDCSKAPSWVDGNVQHCQVKNQVSKQANATVNLKLNR